MIPDTRYTKSGTVNIAYQVVGEGPHDLVCVPGFVSHLDLSWEYPDCARFYQRLASFSRLILLDKRGTGLSDRISDTAPLELRMDDMRAVMDATGSRQAAIFGMSEGGPMSLLFAATYPERTLAVILYASFARRVRAPDYPIGLDEEESSARPPRLSRDWPLGADVDILAPSLSSDAGFKSWFAYYCRSAASPGAAEALSRMSAIIDVRHVLSTIRVPCLILHRVGDRFIDIEHSRYLARTIAGARLVELPGNDHLPWVRGGDDIAVEVEEFLTGTRPVSEPDRVLATVLFTDIVESTQRAAQLGDQRWRSLLEQHRLIVRRSLDLYGGREIQTTGDGFLATFDGPARAIRCAKAIMEASRRLGIEIRAGLHTGECELIGGDIGGLAVHIAARIAALAGPNEILSSRTVKDLVVGSGINFTVRGVKQLKGVPGQWDLFAAEL